MYDVQHNRPAMLPLASVIKEVEQAHGGVSLLPTGFIPLDAAIGGGLATREFTVVGGAPGVGKTSITLQWARHMATLGRAVAYICYEHDNVALLSRLMLLELGELVEGVRSASAAARAALKHVVAGTSTLSAEMSGNLLLRAAFTRVEAYSHKLWLMRASPAETGLEEIAACAERLGDGSAVFVDYLQKVRVIGDWSDDERFVRVAEGLKEISLEHGAAVVAIAATDRTGLNVRRVALHHVRGASGVAFEADLVLMLNEKHLAVSKVHSAFDSVAAERFKRMLVLSVDKNRDGPTAMDFEFEKDLLHFRLNPNGGHVEERLIDDLIYPD